MEKTSRNYDIQVEPIYIGEDMIFSVTGGKAHIGAVATAYFKENNIIIKCNSLPNHKEGDLAEEFAKLACENLKVSVTVVVGIHIDNATKEEILTLVKNAEIKFEEVLKTVIKNKIL
ncbi:prenylated flavin chaperone LpdD [Clostridium felsineum]|uniref:Prenylated flavin chaperone LpdD-like domain-containing protein n=1 Tax=Clostridium felsineum TaxID=36839 RepID=A0A1S8KWY8_9CLOT|nr:hypothetical protein [Clostridium felsineum]URZ00339.1 hypothetical protein CLAUR_003270 [Clostridium felsineum]URZ07024.1 hypothetical protein CLROS_023570 [Clostridium felsineum]URZ12054.1 hypothetical protein CROST_027710 [Clostridium felsineum]